MTKKKKPTNQPEPADTGARLKQAYDDRFDDVSAAVFVVMPPDGRIVSVNVEAEELTGYERSELEGMYLADIFREEDRQRINTIFGSSVGLDFRKLFEHNVIVRKRSRRKIMVDMGFRRTASAGGFVFTLQDITDLKTNEERVVRAHEYVNNIINSVVEIMVVADSEGRIESVNAAALEYLGYDEATLVGRPIGQVFPDLPAVADASKGFAEAETNMLAKDGRVFPVLASKSLLRGTQANETRSVLVAMDISERKKSERLIAEQQMVIVQASKMSSLGEMASSIAHEINNPLQVILGRCELLDMLTEDGGANASMDEIRSGIQLIDRMSQRINKIIRGLQALARDQRGDNMEVVDIADIVKETLSLCEQRIKTRVQRFKVPEFKQPMQIKCRPTQISQVLLNLLNNSYDEVADKPGAFIALEVQQVGDEIEMVITDSGRGIPKEVADRLFTPFFTTKPVGKGTGIGLSISKSLIESHGGRLELDRASKNTRFVIRLPAAAAVQKAG